MYKGGHMTSKSGGPCWSRDRGYHHPKPLPAHIQRILTSPKRKKKKRPATSLNETEPK